MRRRSVGRASAARRPRVDRASTARRRSVGRAPAACGRFGEWSQRSLRCVDACVTVAKHWKSWKSHYNMTLVTSFDAFDARGWRIVVHSWRGKLSIGRNASAARRPHVGRASAAMRRPQCVGRSASTERRPQCGRLCTDLNCAVFICGVN